MVAGVEQRNERFALVDMSKGVDCGVRFQA